MALINQSDLEAKLGRTLTADESNAFTVINAAGQAYVERLIGSSVESANLSYRYYDGGVQHLTIDPCTDLAAVDLVDDDLASTYTYDSSDFQAEPVNRTLKTYLRHRVGFGTGINNIRVQAKFSIYADTDTLNIVKNALISYLASELQNNSNIRRESIEGYSIEYATSESMAAFSQLKYIFPEV